MKPITLWLFILLLTNACSDIPEKEQTALRDKVTEFSDYPVTPVDIRHVKVTDDFWLPIIKRVQEKSIGFALEKCRQEGRFENFLIAGGEMEGEVRGVMPFDDTDVYKIIEGMSISLISAPNEKMELLMDSLISIIKTGQEKDGYLTTWRTINPAKPPAQWVNVDKGERWESLAASHELYNAGHLYEAATAHYLATTKTNFLDIAIKNADLIVETFGPGKIETVPGHQIIETGLIKLYRITGKEEYLELARYFLDIRGDSTMNRQLFGPYSQDHMPVTRQREVVGHAVRAVYMYAGMTDIAAIYEDPHYRTAVEALWENMVNKKMYITGGIGARREGEAFGENYELPNLTAYSETCAAIGSVYWNHRLFMLTGDVKYFDVIERTLYNGVIAGISLDGTEFFYPNVLESDGKYAFNMGKCTRQSWFDCSCCPTNLMRFIPSIPGLIYSKRADTLFVNLYSSNTAEVNLNGHQVKISQQSSLPWSGRVDLTIDHKADKVLQLKLRVPGWVRGEVLPGDLYHYADSIKGDISLVVNQEKIRPEISGGYITLPVNSGQTSVSLEFPMRVREVRANEKVDETRNMMALEYGPIVYAVEEVDNKGKFARVAISGTEKYRVSKKDDLLGGINVIEALNDEVEFTAIPYYAWSNRGINKMKVWLPGKN